MTQLELKLEYMFIQWLLETLGEDDGTIRYEGDVIECAGGAAIELCKFLPNNQPKLVYWLCHLRNDLITVLLGSGCKHNVSGIRSALHVYRRGDTGIWW